MSSYSDADRRRYAETAQAAEELAVEEFLSGVGSEVFSPDDLAAAVANVKFDRHAAVQALRALEEAGRVSPGGGGWQVVLDPDEGPFFHIRVAAVDARDLLSGPLYALDLPEDRMIRDFVAPYQESTPLEYGDRRLQRYRAPKITRTFKSGRQTVETIRERLKRSRRAHSASEAEELFFSKASQDVTENYIAGPPRSVDAAIVADEGAESDPRQIGPWTLLERLGDGGNAVVWRASRQDRPEDIVALKVLKSTKAQREPYQRFRVEIETLRRLDNPPGVLPLLDAYLPESPSKADRPWLSMPIATPIRAALAGEPLERVVEAIAAIATTLARLGADDALAHRDLKPGNLYELDGERLVGDFGLIALPDADELTRTGRPLGPVHYMPYEMLSDPANADPFRVDVYSLAKTLWVLATEQTYPVEGHQSTAERKYSIAELRPHRYASVLDGLIDRATRADPEHRPTMEQFAAELREWRALPRDEDAFDPGDIGADIRRRLANELDQEDLQDQMVDAFTAAVRTIIELGRPLNEGLKQVHPRAEIDITADTFTENMLVTPDETGRPEVIRGWHRLSQIGSGPDYDRFVLRVGRGLELTADGSLIFRSYVDVGDPDTSRTDYFWSSDDLMAPVGTVEAETMLRAAIKELTEKVSEALVAFRDGLSAGADA
jgi:hypothetical protein